MKQMKGIKFNVDVGKGGIKLRDSFYKIGNYYGEP